MNSAVLMTAPVWGFVLAREAVQREPCGRAVCVLRCTKPPPVRFLRTVSEQCFLEWSFGNHWWVAIDLCGVVARNWVVTTIIGLVYLVNQREISEVDGGWAAAQTGFGNHCLRTLCATYM